MIKNTKLWNTYKKKNTDPYGGACIKVAERVMEMLDTIKEPLEKGYYPNKLTAHGIICIADDETKAGGITGFMASCVASMVYHCHSRGNEFRKSYEDKV